ncbi:MAG: Succinate--CoA ligase [ADP-forming] subunit beta [Phycisphaerae bacterium]|nr:Succinate--CoA ligase [ADP-forming] subunit beta [Phycisphaerae bacterium]
MRIHEYQARGLLAEVGVPVPASQVVTTVQEAIEAFHLIDTTVVIKAQVFAGGRGKAGFVKLCSTEAEVKAAAQFMLTNRMISPQTGPEGIPVGKLLIAASVDIESEYYLGMVVDRSRHVPVMMVSREGGVEIEEVAARNPQAIVKEWLHPHLGLMPYQVGKLVDVLGFTQKQQISDARKAISGLATVFLKEDATLAEINPLVRTKDGRILALDAKMTFDDNALFRHKRLQDMHDPTEENPAELRAKQHELSYIALDGNIGCLVNGAGLAMATMDIIKLHGGQPANFLDVGGGVTTERAIEAFKIILSDPQVRGILVNIFGGIAKCDVIAGALIAAAQEIGFRVPVVVRLEGTNVDKARQMLKEANIQQLVSAGDLTDAAKKVCAAV